MSQFGSAAAGLKDTYDRAVQEYNLCINVPGLRNYNCPPTSVSTDVTKCQELKSTRSVDKNVVADAPTDSLAGMFKCTVSPGAPVLGAPLIAPESTEAEMAVVVEEKIADSRDRD
jgi:hypothetical protein